MGQKGIQLDLNPSGKLPVIAFPTFDALAFARWENSTSGKTRNHVPFSALLLSEASALAPSIVRDFLLLGRGDWLTRHTVPFLSYLTAAFMRTHTLNG